MTRGNRSSIDKFYLPFKVSFLFEILVSLLLLSIHNSLLEIPRLDILEAI